MTSKKVQVQVEERVWRKLNHQKKVGETLSDVIERNLQNENTNK